MEKKRALLHRSLPIKTLVRNETEKSAHKLEDYRVLNLRLPHAEQERHARKTEGSEAAR